MHNRRCNSCAAYDPSKRSLPHMLHGTDNVCSWLSLQLARGPHARQKMQIASYLSRCMAGVQCRTQATNATVFCWPGHSAQHQTQSIIISSCTLHGAHTMRETNHVCNWLLLTELSACGPDVHYDHFTTYHRARAVPHTLHNKNQVSCRWSSIVIARIR
jgi:hypothetical protein